MKENLLKKLICPACASEELNVECKQKNDTEIREGSICCQKCREVFPINAGITNLLYRIPQDVECEKKAMNEKVYYVTSDKKEGFTVTEDAIQKYQQILLSLPEGDGSPIFCCGGSLQNQAENASRFYKSVDELNLTGNEDILEVGASFGWGSREFAKKGCNVVALDITDFLCTSDLYFKQQSIYFDRILGDMNKLPFKTASFDIVFANTVLHHCMDLETIYRELLRVLKREGK
ncbi:MAG: methyltransferase domain-containing protein [Candidatus Omnitrophota bacterium]